MRLRDKSIFLGISGSVSAYKSADLIRLLKKEGAQVQVALTEAATHFITPTLCETLSQNEVMIGALETRIGQIPHVDEAYAADLFLVAPATANTLSKLANGQASCSISSTFLSFRGDVVIAPAMETNMWNHFATQKNVETLKAQGVHFVGPESGPLASGRTGSGRLSPPNEIVEFCVSRLNGGEAARSNSQDLAQKRILISAGPTVEDLDPVRFISNRSSGKMGKALAEAARDRGAEVILVHGPLQVSLPQGVSNIAVRSAKNMHDKIMHFLDEQSIDVVVMAAAVADYTPAKLSSQKIKKSEEEFALALTRTTDILKALGQRQGRPFLVGFAAESENVVENARSKRKRKGCDVICANSIAGPQGAFANERNQLTLVAEQQEITLPAQSKRKNADAIFDLVLSEMKG